MATNRNVLNLYNFSESRFTALSHELRVYIFGADVTPWLTSQVSLQRADRDGISSLSFSLSNAYRAFEITGDNFKQTQKSL